MDFILTIGGLFLLSGLPATLAYAIVMQAQAKGKPQSSIYKLMILFTILIYLLLKDKL